MSDVEQSVTIEAVVCIPTFRRPSHLRKTLESLAAQVTTVKFAVVVAENNFAQCDGKKVADAFFLESALEGFCVIEPRQGNCFAINCAFGTALRAYPQAPYLLMIDDDETATPGWIEEMVRAARLHKSDLVGGPVLRAFEGDATPAIRSHPIFGDYLRPSGFVASLWGSGNCLIGRQVFEALGEPSFDMRFNFLGGGDMEFFTRCKRLGFKAYWNSNAVAIETVPAQRTELAWMLKRSVVIGVINYTIDRKGAPTAAGYILLWAKNFVSLGISLCRAAKLYAQTRHFLPASFPLCVSVGRIYAAMGFSPTAYKA